MRGDSPDNRLLRQNATKMLPRNPKEVFLRRLSARQNTERAADVYQSSAENPNVRETLESRAFMADKNVEALVGVVFLRVLY